ncbi:hypothetical protein [Mycobacteroides abscessus]|uniref:hypothetical protein n=1 Tax=Mycobacteroides abscessus TaxID=36809 RepID=UPI000C25DE02|nr:hypothetical protein [Mycobacteroides abscessus]
MTIIDQRYHPWQHLGQRYPNIRVLYTDHLPCHTPAHTDGRLIWLSNNLDQAGRRSRIAHAIVHLQQHQHCSPAGEFIANTTAAYRLIGLHDLIDAYQHHPGGSISQLAQHLWVDQHTLAHRLATLDPIETAELEHHTDGTWIPLR